jgi:hypothetical protein
MHPGMTIERGQEVRMRTRDALLVRRLASERAFTGGGERLIRR